MMSRHLTFKYGGVLRTIFFKIRFCLSVTIRQRELERHRSGDPSEQQTDIILETETKPIACRLGCGEQEEGALIWKLSVQIANGKTWGGWQLCVLICHYATFTGDSEYPGGVGSGGSVSSNDDEWFPGASPGSAAGTEPVSLCHTECHIAPRRPFYHLPVFVYFGSHLNCTESVSHPFSPEGGTPCCLFGSSDSFNFHLSSLPLCLLVLGSHLTALAG